MRQDDVLMAFMGRADLEMTCIGVTCAARAFLSQYSAYRIDLRHFTFDNRFALRNDALIAAAAIRKSVLQEHGIKIQIPYVKQRISHNVIVM